MTIDLAHARVIERLRDAAREHGEVAELLRFLATDVRVVVPAGDDGRSRAYAAAVLAAAAFAELDRGDQP